MNLIFIFRQLSKKEISQIQLQAAPGKAIIFFEEPEHLSKDLAYLKNERIILPTSGISGLWEQSIKEINAFGHKQFYGKSIIEWLSFQKNTYWYYVRPILFINYKAHRLEIEKILMTLSQFGLSTVERIDLFGGSFGTGFYLDEDIKVKIHGVKKFKLIKYIGLLNYFIIFGFRFTIGIIQLIRLFNRKNKHILFEDAYKIQKTIDLTTLKSVTGDSYIEYLKEKAYNDNDFLLLSELTLPKLAKDPLFLRREYVFSKYLSKAFYGEMFFAFVLLNPMTWIGFFRFSALLKKSVSLIRNNLQEPNDKLMFSILGTMRTMIALCWIREKTANLFFKIVKPASIGGDHEHELKNKPYLTVAPRHNIPTYGIQHGTIHPLHFHYFFSEEDKKYKPYPDHTIMWGEYWKNMIVAHSIFTENEIKILGHTRTDCVSLLKQLRKSDVMRELNNAKPVILFASQWVRGGEEYMRKQIIEDFIHLSTEHPEIQFIVKPHPLETDLSIYNRFLRKNQNHNLYLVYEDIYKLIAISDITLLYASTVGTEVVYFKKDLIILNYFNNDFSGYIKDGVAIGVTNYRELKLAVHKLLNKELIIDKKAQENFINERAYKIDGKTCDRYIDFIRSIAKS